MVVKQYLIIDDSEPDAFYLKGLLSRFTFFNLVGIAPTIESAVQFLSSQSIDLIFLDISLDGQLGLSLLKTGMTLPPVIITSAYPDYALESYEIGKAADYLLKPFTLERLQISLTRALQWQNQPTVIEKNEIFLKMGRKAQRFVFQSIDYIEAFGIYSKVYADNQMYLVNEGLALLIDQLPARLFIRVHKSYVININKITSYDRHTIWLGQTKIPIGRSFRPSLEGLLSVFDTNSNEEP
ncbi:response regulator transcription factor [Spirosoma sp. KCTC 42546]|uniref:LytR/AlgR family response regulator transcription factor n=1 Tax=Spirosoma sp. KCTC 42546 TaxID=2520506 RepID=UPI00115BDB7D|nr:LytTR family DNA-binding domain-containing protein [Spirosoma sp. KCTC 42546]QDK78691.1 response regulator transcription factor [Spirosoma sp. KCTC 42546]